MSTVAEMMRAANPVGDPVTALPDNEFEALLLLTKESRGKMDVKEVQKLETVVPEGSRRRGLLVAAAVFALVIAGATLAVVLMTGEDPPDVGDQISIPLIGAENDPEALQAFATVEAAYEAYNSGDMATWVAASNAGETWGEDLLAKITTWREGEHAADGRIDVLECRFDGRSPLGFEFSCDTTSTTALHTAAGMQLAEVYEWLIAADGTVVRSGSTHLREGLGVSEDAWFEYSGDYLFWLSSNHPEVHNQMEIVELLGLRLLAASSVPLALEYIDEYAATLE